MNKQTASLAAGLAMLLAGLLISRDSLFQVFGGAHASMGNDFSNGALLFKACLCVIGIYIILSRFISVPDELDTNAPIISASNRRQDFVFLGLLAVAILLRLYQLDQGIWFDEMLTHVIYMPHGLAEIIGTYSDPNNHLFFSVLARLSLSIFGDTVWAFRLPAVLFGVGSIAALYYFARRLTSTNVSLLAAALLTFSYHHIWFSQNARGYTMLLFFTLASSTFLLDALQTNKPSRWLIYGATAALGVFTHLTMGFVVAGQFIIYAGSQLNADHAERRNWWVGLCYGFIPLGLLSIQAYSLILPGMLGGSLLSSGLQGEGSEWSNPIWALMEVVNGLQIGFTNGSVAVGAIVVFAVGLIDVTRRTPSLTGLFVIPVVLSLGLMTAIGYTLFPRFFFFAMGFGAIIVMCGATVVGESIARKVRLPPKMAKWMPVFLCVAIVGVSIPSLRYVYFPKQDFAGVIDLIDREFEGGDEVVTIGIAGFPFNDYYKLDWKNVRTIEELNAIEANSNRVWIIYTMPIQAQSAYPEIFDRISRDYELVRRFFGTLNDGDVVVSLKNASQFDPRESLKSNSEKRTQE